VESAILEIILEFGNIYGKLFEYMQFQLRISDATTHPPPDATAQPSPKPSRAPVARLAALLGRSLRSLPAVLASPCFPERARPSGVHQARRSSVSRRIPHTSPAACGAHRAARGCAPRPSRSMGGWPCGHSRQRAPTGLTTRHATERLPARPVPGTGSARASFGRTRERSERGEPPRRPRGEVWGHHESRNHHALADSRRASGHADRRDVVGACSDRTLDEARRRKHHRVSEANPRSAASRASREREGFGSGSITIVHTSTESARASEAVPSQPNTSEQVPILHQNVFDNGGKVDFQI
jgi:hypothetical protein